MTQVAGRGRAPWGSSWVRWALAGLAAAAAALALPQPAAAEGPEAAGVVIVGIPGLSWADIDEGATPNLWALADEGASAAMSVRTLGSWTCPEAGWVSLGAGERAGGVAARDAQCSAQSALEAPADTGSGWTVEGWDAFIEANSAFNYGARLGSLADALAEAAQAQQEAAAAAAADGEPAPEPNPGSCVAGIGDGAALAAADTEGRIAYWAPGLDALPEAMAACDVVIVDPGVVVGDADDRAPDTTTDYDQLGEDDTEVGTDATSPVEDAGAITPDADPVREAAARAADAAVGQVREALPEDWRLIVAGVADAAAPSSLHPVLYTGPGIAPGELTSSTTGRDGYVQLTDLTATALAVVGADIPAAVAGSPVAVRPDPGHTAAAAVARGVDETAASAANAAVSPNFYWTLSFTGVAVMLAAAYYLTGPDRLRRTVRTLLIAFSTVPVAGLAAGIPPWWRTDHPKLAFWGLIVAGAAILTAAVSLPWTRRGARPVLIVAGACAALIAVDQISGATWPLHTPMGYTAQAGARFTGLGNYAFSVFAAAIILLVCFIPWRGRTRVWGPLAIGACAVVIVGAPMLGRDMGGTLTLVAAGILCCLKLWGRRLSLGSLALAGGLAFTVFAVGGVLDYLRPEEDQTHLGRFVGSVLDGSAQLILIRKARAALGTVDESMAFISFAALVAAVIVWRRRAPIRTTPVAAAVTGLTTVAVIGGLVNDSGMAIPGFTAALAFGLLAVAVGPRRDQPAPAPAPPATRAPAAT
ncbi:hypothetical protein [Glycomyces terrestris]|uniref:hypothetical protein n=1 Tax=Glycomyces terrestris TaxID=2493553 RepID=UPI0013153EA8|nr:hypothetical protein [Glycomyces terrestris]